MTRYAIDAPTALRLIDDPRSVATSHTLVAPVLLPPRAPHTLDQKLEFSR